MDLIFEFPMSPGVKSKYRLRLRDVILFSVLLMSLCVTSCKREETGKGAIAAKEDVARLLRSAVVLSHADVSRLSFAANSELLASLDTFPAVSNGVEGWEYLTTQERQEYQMKWFKLLSVHMEMVCSRFDTLFAIEDSIESVGYSADNGRLVLGIKCNGIEVPTSPIQYHRTLLGMGINIERNLVTSGFIAHEKESMYEYYKLVTETRKRISDKKFTWAPTGESFYLPLDTAKKYDVNNRRGVLKQLCAMKPIHTPILIKVFDRTTRIPDSLCSVHIGTEVRDAIWITDSDTIELAKWPPPTVAK